jgi:hypothetical protein
MTIAAEMEAPIESKTPLKIAAVITTILGVLAAVPGVLLTLATGAVAQTFPPSVPMTIVCYAQQSQSWRVGYLYRVEQNGDTIYLLADGKQGARVNAKGVVVAPTNRPAGLDCYGKTVDELRQSGRVMDFQFKR